MNETVYQLRINQTVETPHGKAIVQGRMVDDDGKTFILVSYDPKDPELPDEVRQAYKGGIWILYSYPLEDIKPISSVKRMETKE